MSGGSAGDDFVEKVKWRACAWPRREQRTEGVRLLSLEELRGMVVFEDERLLVVNKPGDVVCHPSKAGEWSSLAGAVRAGFGLEAAHLIFRLDRETSGVVVFAKDRKTASRLQKAVMERRVGKKYVAIVCGRFEGERRVEEPLGADVRSPVYIKSAVTRDAGAGAQEAVTVFRGLRMGREFSVVEAVLETGRKHQIRAHAQWLGHSVVGDKIYGPSELLYLEFIEKGWAEELKGKLLMERQALHCAEIDLRGTGVEMVLRAEVPMDMRKFWEEREGDWV